MSIDSIDFTDITAFPENFYLITNEADEIAYEEWYEFKKWHKIHVNFLEYKLRTGENLTTNHIMGFFRPTKLCGFCVRRGSMSYDLYINHQEPYFDFRSKILKQDIYIIQIFASTYWTRQQYDTSDRKREEASPSDLLYNEGAQWIYDNSTKMDLLNNPEHHGSRDTFYQRSALIMTDRESIARNFYQKFAKRIESCGLKDPDRTYWRYPPWGDFIDYRIRKRNFNNRESPGGSSEFTILTY